MSNLENALLGFINEKQGELGNQEPIFVIDAFREQLDNMQSIVKLFRKNRHKIGFEKGAYNTIAELLFEQGITKKNESKLSEAQVCRYLHIVRAEKKADSKNKVITRKAVEARSAPSHVAAPVPVSKATVAVPAAPGVTPIPVTDWLAELLRLEAASNAEWNGQDQWMWDEMEKVAKKYGKNLARDFVSVERNLDGIQVHCLRVLLNKRLYGQSRLQK